MQTQHNAMMNIINPALTLLGSEIHTCCQTASGKPRGPCEPGASRKGVGETELVFLELKLP